MNLRRRTGPLVCAGRLMAALMAVWLTGCPERVDVSPEEDGPISGEEQSRASTPAERTRLNGSTASRRFSVPVHLAAQTTIRPQGSRVARGTPAAERATDGGRAYDGEGGADDPAAANAEIFVDWPRPQIALLFSGEQDGYLEPCGCAGLENQKGGLSRRHSLFKQLRGKGWPVVPLDLGGQIKRIGPQAEIKFRHALDSLITLGYQAVAFGPRDLRVDVLGVAVNLDAAANPFVSANVALVEFESGFTKRFRVIEAAGRRIGVTSVLGKAQQQGLENLEFVQFVDPADALREVVPQLQAANCDYLVLLSHASPEESQQLAREFPIFDFVLTAGGAEEPPAATAPIPGNRARLIEVGHKGMYVAVVGIYDEGGRRSFRYQRVPLDSRFPDSPEMHQMMTTYQRELRTIGLEGLGLSGARHDTGREFVGTQKCAECHLDAMGIWEITPHSHATETLVKLDPPRQFDPECLSCHATGWNPQKYFPYSSGFLGLDQTPHMRANGCENCHGPGSSHVAAETGEEAVDDAEKLRRRGEMRLSLVENEGNKEGQTFGKVVQNCMQCHDLDNSPDFDFQVYWPEVEHYGKQ